MDNGRFWEDLSGRSWPLAGIPDRSGNLIGEEEIFGVFAGCWGIDCNDYVDLAIIFLLLTFYPCPSGQAGD